MKSLSLGIIFLASPGLFLLGGCANETQTNNRASTSSPPSATTTTQPIGTEKSHTAPRQGGQVVESGKYHLELVPVKEGDDTHLDFYVLEGDKHQAVATAKVTADVQLPNGQEKTMVMKYDPEGKHYAAALGEKATGKYQVKIFVTIDTQTVDGRFSFDR